MKRERLVGALALHLVSFIFLSLSANAEAVRVADCERDAKLDFWAAADNEFCVAIMNDVFQTAGVEYGYAWRLGKYWRLQAFGAIGWMATHYRYYEANQGDTRLIYKYPGRYTWFGPTKLGVSIEVIIPNDFWMKKRR